MATKREVVARLSTEDLLALANAAVKRPPTPEAVKRVNRAVKIIKKLEGNR